MKTTVTPRSLLSNATVHRRCSRNGQKYWWLRGPNGFVPIPGSPRGDKDFEVELELEPGTYTLGAGPNSNHGHRETIKVA